MSYNSVKKKRGKKEENVHSSLCSQSYTQGKACEDILQIRTFFLLPVTVNKISDTKMFHLPINNIYKCLTVTVYFSKKKYLNPSERGAQFLIGLYA